ncbi:hypothetical protein BBP40_000605 [Aspergillus hancockii]|nr:hypothetical protein BBP40_000605 [Aspergillus hancockii]
MPWREQKQERGFDEGTWRSLSALDLMVPERSSTIDFFKGNRIPCAGARVTQKIMFNQFLNLHDDELEGKLYICGERFGIAEEKCGWIGVSMLNPKESLYT